MDAIMISGLGIIYLQYLALYVEDWVKEVKLTSCLLDTEERGSAQIPFLVLQGDECHPEMRLKKRIESAINFIKRCGNARYIVFWASIWEFRMWRKYDGYFNGKTVILKPWKLAHIILK